MDMAALIAPAFGQTLRPAFRDDGPLPSVKPRTPPKAAPLPPAPEPEPETAGLRVRPVTRDMVLPEGTVLVEFEPEPEPEQPPTGVRLAVRDGMPEPGVEGDPGEDGLLLEAEPYRNP